CASGDYGNSVDVW
nr:immunoglobulin heavy chain junction region [Macaca mulatta]MOV38355.1 immunoglobulin heavy chain junction region [Macaca mulatta]MOV38713.1 immunoglobulin heavy chain junction region [Macaca mulatta]MOV38815.1 immunoglobulin heavy chain junction region [Macaca mulatta]MOV39415.1 immunoglobulin heavy chain junction region [Macaca mulatta]